MDAHQCMEAKWCLVSKGQEKEWRVEVWRDEHQWKWEEAEKRAQEKAMKKAQEEAERQAEEACKAQEEAEKKEKEEREAVAWKAREAAEAHVDDEKRVLEDRLWEEESRRNAEEVVSLCIIRPSMDLLGAGPSSRQCSEGSAVQDSCSRCHSKGICRILGAAKGKMTAYDQEVIKVGKDEDEEEMWSHFVVLTHLMEEHWDALGVLMTTLDVLSMDFLAFHELQRANDLKEEEMGRSKGKGKEKAKEEGPRRRTEDDDRDTEIGGAGPSSLV
ncbi:hypothetical protein ID866_11138 [Astraeus odoratus]|nr:hypothetical protein ID866_11138 [Astraeus odoratus]